MRRFFKNNLFKNNSFFNNRKEILKVRVELARERKWMFISVASVALAILCNSAFSMILTAISMFLAGIATVFKACCFVVSGIIDIISKGLGYLKDRILN